MEPIPETIELLDLLRVGRDDNDRLEDWLLTRAQQVAARIPDCVGVSIALFGEEDLTFTFVVTMEQLRVIDAAQFLDGGPCEESAHEHTKVEADLLSEERWQLAAAAGAASGVNSSLSLPIRAKGGPVGSVNFYGSGPGSFAAPAAQELAGLFGAAAEEAVSNADLAMTGVDRARASTERVRDRATVDLATGVLAERENITLDEARQRIHDAAARAGVAAESLANVILGTHSGSES